MLRFLPLSPRYRLDDDAVWLKGIDPSRHYWIYVNGEVDAIAIIPGLMVESLEALRQIFYQFRSLEAGDSLRLERASGSFTIHCVSQNCYGIEHLFQGALVWHLFDQETLESLLRTAHPDWQCAPSDLELGREVLMRSWQQAIAA